MTEEQVKELIAEMEARAVTFNTWIEKYIDIRVDKEYWRGKLSETEFVINKLKEFLNN